MKLKGVVITVNYPNDEVEAAVPNEMTVRQLFGYIDVLLVTEKDMTSFVIDATIDKD